MTDRLAYVYADLEGTPHLVGCLYAHNNTGKETATFEYEADWLANPLRYALEPALALGKGQYHTPRKLFGSLGDSAPDRWGRRLMKRAEARRAEADKTKARTLNEMDYLLMVNDETRQGALRFANEPSAPFRAHDGAPVPPLINLPKLLSATDALLEDVETAAEHRKGVNRLIACVSATRRLECELSQAVARYSAPALYLPARRTAVMQTKIAISVNHLQ
ncbi:hypothetical protein EH240_22275 [Mesorhizobium tamadayense]|uniref:HipA N-terminal subdomain 1 domain-containing protein n=1 Tax=Mesorhizobium tamadayense TaxID=425306 RepID=A0A3P3FDS9_9HYPH|nr:HipA N-terminal domain-containing protein [Mesorhizobium tamadayense]RRH96701.1 hypothetical protein EH240_22275 [Mesorhizobium tamadayense]